MRFVTSLPISLPASLIAAAAALSATAAAAQEQLEVIGRPTPGAMGFQTPVTELARDLISLDNLVLYIITFVTALVCVLLLAAIIFHNRRVRPVPSQFSHNAPLEITWTVLPILTLIVIGAFSLPVLFKQQEIPMADITIKATGHQWYWSYEYPDQEFEFESYMIGSPATGGDNRLDADVEAQLIEAGYTRQDFLLATDTAMVVPVNKTIVVQVTAADVIHSWALPAFGVKQDGVPGRLAQLWFKAEQEGIYFGQCSELCGLNHAYMPITVKVVSEAAYEEWLEGAIEEYAGRPAPLRVAAAE